MSRIESSKNWRTREQRLRLVGDICPRCERPRFPPGGTDCPMCPPTGENHFPIFTTELGRILVAEGIEENGNGNGHH